MIQDVREREFGRKIKTYLDRDASALKPGTAYRLQLARQQALARVANGQLAEATAAPGRGGAVAGMPGGGGTGRGRAWLVAMVLVVLAGLVGYWQYTASSARELEEIDAALLSGDLPVDAFLDKGFQAWLFQGEQR